MVPVTPIFPLSKLPYLVWKNVMATMDSLDFITCSTCSRKFKNSLRSVFFRHSNKLIFDIWDNRSVFNIKGHTTNIKLALDSLVTPCSLRVNPQQSVLTFIAKDWITLLMELFNCEGVHLGFIDCRSVEPEVVRAAVQGHVIFELRVIEEHPNLSRILELFSPSHRLHLRHKPEQFTSLACLRDLKYIYLVFPVSYEDLLVVNSARIEFFRTEMSTAQFNAYLKAWLAGSLAPKLQLLSIRFRKDTLSEDYTSEMLNGIDYRLVDEGEPGFIVPYDRRQRRLENGYNMTKSDGTKASIYFDNVLNNVVVVYVSVRS